VPGAAWALFVPVVVACLSAAQAAEIVERPDLVGRLAAFSRIFPTHQTPSLFTSSSGVEFGMGLPVLDLGDDTPKVFEVSGPIVAGGAEKLDQVFAAGVQRTIVVFNSPGGSFVEGIKLGAVLAHHEGFYVPDLDGVFILSGQKCQSACALAFAGAPVGIRYRGRRDHRVPHALPGSRHRYCFGEPWPTTWSRQ
jgi:hypothetical protein